MALNSSTKVDEIIQYLNSDGFQIPSTQPMDSYFPDFLKEALNNYVNYYEKNLLELIDEKFIFNPAISRPVFSKIKSLTDTLIEVVTLFYEGKILDAIQAFNKSLQKVLYEEINSITSIDVGACFYRARVDENKHFSRQDLFHVRFELRHIVSTNRYSIPGFPALYLGDTTYVCWEEFNRHRLNELWFSRFSNTKKLNVVYIQRFDDFISEFNSIRMNLKPTFLMRYLVLFPLTIACSLKAKNSNANFKPEYIIPQMLLQFISTRADIDGIKFFSTKVDYERITDVSVYNYVFPVKKIKATGFCSELTKTFDLTEPTSLELEKIISDTAGFNPEWLLNTPSKNMPKIELVNGVRSWYGTTTFGTIEFKLHDRKTGKVNSD